jgi:hypothetical protein
MTTPSDGPPPTDPDDWFSDESAADERWADEEPPVEPRRATLPPFNPRWWAIGIGVALVLLVGGLAIGGVFSGGGNNNASSETTTTTPATTRPTTTAAPPAPTVPVPPATLLPGSTDVAAVKKLQRALKEAGYSPGAIDGDYGPSTQEAVKKFQTAQHLDADGVYGPKTEVALKKALQTG